MSVGGTAAVSPGSARTWLALGLWALAYVPKHVLEAAHVVVADGAVDRKWATWAQNICATGFFGDVAWGTRFGGAGLVPRALCQLPTGCLKHESWLRQQCNVDCVFVNTCCVAHGCSLMYTSHGCACRYCFIGRWLEPVLLLFACSSHGNVAMCTLRRRVDCATWIVQREQGLSKPLGRFACLSRCQGLLLFQCCAWDRCFSVQPKLPLS